MFNKSYGSSGTILWLFIPPHLERFFCHLQCRLNNYEWVFVKPHIELVNGHPTVIGQIKEDISFQSLLLSIMSKSNLVKYLNFEYPSEYSDEEIKTFALTMADLFKNKILPQANKRIVFVNLYSFSKSVKLFEELKKEKIEVYDLSHINFHTLIKKGNIPLDGHPTSELYWVISSLVYNEIFKKR